MCNSGNIKYYVLSFTVFLIFLLFGIYILGGINSLAYSLVILGTLGTMISLSFILYGNDEELVNPIVRFVELREIFQKQEYELKRLLKDMKEYDIDE